MSRPNDIPEDVWEAARDRVVMLDTDDCRCPECGDARTEMVARAVLAEQDRCAKVAAERGYELLKPHFGYGRGADSTHIVLANKIASFIRGETRHAR
jgi:hypothetical protein